MGRRGGPDRARPVPRFAQVTHGHLRNGRAVGGARPPGRAGPGVASGRSGASTFRSASPSSCSPRGRRGRSSSTSSRVGGRRLRVRAGVRAAGDRTAPGRKHIMRATDVEARPRSTRSTTGSSIKPSSGCGTWSVRLRGRRGRRSCRSSTGGWRRASRVVVECCPGSVLKRVNGPAPELQAAGRRAADPQAAADPARHPGVADGVVEVGDRFRRVMMRNPGGDAIDAVVAAVGAGGPGRRPPGHRPHPATGTRAPVRMNV